MPGQRAAVTAQRELGRAATGDMGVEVGQCARIQRLPGAGPGGPVFAQRGVLQSRLDHGGGAGGSRGVVQPPGAMQPESVDRALACGLALRFEIDRGLGLGEKSEIVQRRAGQARPAPGSWRSP